MRPRGGVKCLIELYAGLARVRPDWRFVLMHDGSMPARAEGSGRLRELPAGRFEWQRVSGLGTGTVGWEGVRLPLASRGVDADVLHGPALSCQVTGPLPTVVSVTETSALEADGPVSRMALAQLRQAGRHAAKIVCPSQAMRSRLEAKLGCSPERVAVVPFAADSAVQNAQEVSVEVFARLGIRKRYVVHFGGDERRHNTRRLLEGWAMTDPLIRRKMQLLVLGLDEAQVAAMTEIVDRLQLSKSVLLRGWVEDAELATLLHGARALAYPAMGEAFGQPILDAWATDTPVLISDDPALMELAGDAAALADPSDPCAIARRLQPVLTERTLRRELQARGRARLAHFGWDRSAELFARVLEQAAACAEPALSAA